MIKTKKQGLLIVLSGPSGSGKNTVCDEVKKNNPNIWESVSMTSRKPRQGEEDGKVYYFVSEEEFKKILKLIICLSMLNSRVIIMARQRKIFKNI